MKSQLSLPWGAKLCPFQIHLLKSKLPGPQNVTVFGDKVLKEVIKVKKRGH